MLIAAAGSLPYSLYPIPYCLFPIPFKSGGLSVPALSMMIKPVSSGCNMRCQYCFYADVAAHRQTPNYGVMTPDTMHALVRRAFIHADGQVSFSFQGGEPTLAGAQFYLDFLHEVRRCNSRGLPVSYALQTNGYDVSDEMLALFKEHGFLLGVSLDGPEDMHDALRKDAFGRGTYRRVMRTIEKLRAFGIPYNILCVVTAETARKSRETWNALREHRYLQFIPCIDGLEGGRSPHSLSAEAYGQFLIETYDLYEKAFREGSPVSERRFDNYLSILAGLPPEACGMCGQCGLYYLVEADGSVYPCDFYVLDEWKMGDINAVSLARMAKSQPSAAFRQASVRLPEACRGCPYLNLCRGGCRRDREPFRDGVPSENRFCQSYRMFFDARLPRLASLTERVIAAQQTGGTLPSR